MRTLICDLDAERRRRIGADRRFDVVIGREDLMAARPCAGCRGCWATTPGRCVMRDPLADLGPLLGATSELALVSQAAFGGYGPLVARAVDRCVPYVHPCLTLEGGRTCHRRRHRNALTLSAWLYGPTTPEGRAVSRGLLRATAGYLGAETGDVLFPASWDAIDLSAGDAGDAAGAAGDAGKAMRAPRPGAGAAPGAVPRRLALLCADPRGEGGASWALLSDLADATAAYARLGGVTPPEVALVACPPSGELADVPSLLAANALVVGYSPHVAGLPSGLVAALGRLAAAPARGGRPGVYALGVHELPEPGQLLPSIAVLGEFCEVTGLPWRGAVAVGGGGMVLPTAGSPRMGTLRRRVSEAVDQLALALLAGRPLGVVEARCTLPRLAYALAAEAWWRREARRSGVRLDDAPTPHGAR